MKVVKVRRSGDVSINGEYQPTSFILMGEEALEYNTQEKMAQIQADADNIMDVLKNHIPWRVYQMVAEAIAKDLNYEKKLGKLNY